MVTALKCGICIQFQSAIERWWNYNDRWVIRAESLCTSNVRDHAKTDQYQHAMMLWKKQQATARGQRPSAYSPFARLTSDISEDTMAKLWVIFDLAYFFGTKKIAFNNVCKLEAHHGVTVGIGYNEHAAKTFCHYTAKMRRRGLVANLALAKFFQLWWMEHAIMVILTTKYF